MSESSRAPAAGQWLDAVLILAATVVFVAVAGDFAANQTIWVDETTQLSGLRLPLDELYRWLVGQSDVVLGVPPDRMPPLSYVLGKAWAAIFGLNETSMRWFGITAVVLAVPPLYLAGRTIGGRVGGIFAVAFVLLSPATVMVATEIRAYPLLLSLATWASWSFTRLAVLAENRHRRRDLVLLGVFLVLAGYTHFFGVVLAGSMFLGLLVHRLAGRRPIVAILVAAVLTLVVLAGLAPFIVHAFSISGGPAAGPEAAAHGLAAAVTGAARLAFRVVLSPVLLATPIILAGMAATLLVLIAILAGAVWLRRRRSSDAATSIPIAMVVAIVAAVVGLAALKLVVSSFDVLSESYNIWMVPLVALLLAQTANATGYPRLIATGLMVLLSIGELVGLSTVVRVPTLYSHGPSEWLMARVDDPSSTLVIYDTDDPWGHVYFPLYYLSGGAITQWLEHDGRAELITEDTTEPVADPAAAEAGFKTVLRVRVGYLDSATLAAIASGRLACPAATAAISAGEGDAPYCAFFAARVSSNRTVGAS